jgi:hypothetical protein
MQRDLSECAARLTRYLHYDAVTSGEAIKAAREDYRNVSRERQIETTLPEAWARLIGEEDESLLELVAERVALLCGFKPDLKTVVRFLKGNRGVKHTYITATPVQRDKLNVERPIGIISHKDSPETKIGKLVQDILKEMFANNEVSAEEVEKMQTKEYSKKTFNINYPLLLIESPLTKNKEKRYWRKKGSIEVYGNKYFICSQWFESDRPYFEKWCASRKTNVLFPCPTLLP